MYFSFNRLNLMMFLLLLTKYCKMIKFENSVVLTIDFQLLTFKIQTTVQEKYRNKIQATHKKQFASRI